MGSCVHHVPGRARFIVPNLRGSESCSIEIREKLAKLDGVIMVKPNLLAGSVVVQYDPKRVGMEVIHRTLNVDPLYREGAVPSPSSRMIVMVGSMFGRAFASALLERAIGLGVAALVRR